MFSDPVPQPKILARWSYIHGAAVVEAFVGASPSAYRGEDQESKASVHRRSPRQRKPEAWPIGQCSHPGANQRPDQKLQDAESSRQDWAKKHTLTPY
jgi:hypothetical protein